MSTIENQIESLKNQNDIDSFGYKIPLKYIVYVSIFFILFGLFAPIILSQYTLYGLSNKPNEIGDAIGGMMNPFIAIAGVILTFLAFYMQWQANQNQVKLLKLQIDLDKEKLKNQENENLKEIFQLFELELNEFLEELSTKFEHIKDYNSVLKLNEIEFVILPKIHKEKAKSLLKYDKMIIYKCYRLFVSKGNSDWKIEFNELYDELEYLNAVLPEFYRIESNSSTQLYELKKEYEVILNLFIDKCWSEMAKMKSSSELKQRYDLEYDLFNSTILEYYRIIDDSNIINKDKFIKETDLLTIDKDVIENFIKKTIEIKKSRKDFFYNELDQLLSICSDLRKRIGKMKNSRINLITQVEVVLNDNFNADRNIINEIRSIHTIIKESINTSN